MTDIQDETLSDNGGPSNHELNVDAGDTAITSSTNGELIDQDATAVERSPLYYASMYPRQSDPVPADVAEAVRNIEKLLGYPVWLLVQCGDNYVYDVLGDEVRDLFYSAKSELRKHDKIGLIVDSPGGFASSAYEIATFLRRRCRGFDAIVPRYAKSAATLLILGADTIYLGPDAQLGPLDVQLLDPEREELMSALDDAQALERLTAYALKTVDETMVMLSMKTPKKISTLLPLSLDFVASVLRPMLENVDIVHYTQRSRLLKVAEAYAYRLLRRHFAPHARKIAEHFVSHYPEHGFVINLEEMRGMGYVDLGLVTEATTELEVQLDTLFDCLNGRSCTYIGQIVEEKIDEQKSPQESQAGS